MTRQASPKQAPGALLGLQEDGFALLGKLFAQSCEPLGIDGEAVFQKFSETGTLKGALGLSEDILEALYGRGHQYLKIGQVQRAEGVFRTLCALGGKRSDYWLGYGICLRARGAFVQALEAFDLAIQLDPSSAAPHFHKLELFIREGRWDEAQGTLEHFDAAEVGEQNSYLSDAVIPFRKALEMRGG